MDQLASDMATALKNNDYRLYHATIRSVLKIAGISTEDLMHPVVTKNLDLEGSTVSEIAKKLKKYEFRLLFLHLVYGKEKRSQLGVAAKVSELYYEGLKTNGITGLPVHKGCPLCWKQVACLGKNLGVGNVLQHPEAEKNLQALLVRWRFWFTLLHETESLDAFTSPLVPAYGSKSDVHARITSLLNKAAYFFEQGLQQCGLMPMLGPADLKTPPLDLEGPAEQRGSTVKIIESSAPLLLLELTQAMIGYDVEMAVHFARDGPSHNVILDTGCAISMVGRNFVEQAIPGCNIKPLPRPSFSRGVNSASVIEDYITLDLLVPCTLRKSKRRLARIVHEFRVSDRLSDIMLVGQDVIQHHGIIIYPKKSCATIESFEDAVVELTIREVELSQEPLSEEDRARLLEGQQQRAREWNKGSLQ